MMEISFTIHLMEISVTFHFLFLKFCTFSLLTDPFRGNHWYWPILTSAIHWLIDEKCNIPDCYGIVDVIRRWWPFHSAPQYHYIYPVIYSVVPLILIRWWNLLHCDDTFIHSVHYSLHSLLTFICYHCSIPFTFRWYSTFIHCWWLHWHYIILTILPTFDDLRYIDRYIDWWWPLISIDPIILIVIRYIVDPVDDKWWWWWWWWLIRPYSIYSILFTFYWRDTFICYSISLIFDDTFIIRYIYSFDTIWYGIVDALSLLFIDRKVHSFIHSVPYIHSFICRYHSSLTYILIDYDTFILTSHLFILDIIVDDSILHLGIHSGGIYSVVTFIPLVIILHLFLLTSYIYYIPFYIQSICCSCYSLLFILEGLDTSFTFSSIVLSIIHSFIHSLIHSFHSCCCCYLMMSFILMHSLFICLMPSVVYSFLHYIPHTSTFYILPHSTLFILIHFILHSLSHSMPSTVITHCYFYTFIIRWSDIYSLFWYIRRYHYSMIPLFDGNSYSLIHLFDCDIILCCWLTVVHWWFIHYLIWFGG